MAQFKRPKILGELKIIYNKAGGLSVHNGIKQGENKMMLSCRSEGHCQKVIKKLKQVKPLFFNSINGIPINFAG